jgi:hypothetical protein
MCCRLLLFVIAATAYAQTFVVKDRNGVPAVAIRDVAMFRYSDSYGCDVPLGLLDQYQTVTTPSL